MTFRSFLFKIDPSLYRDYQRERHQSTFRSPDITEPVVVPEPEPEPTSLAPFQSQYLQDLLSLPEDHEVVKYVTRRKIDRRWWSMLGYTEHWRDFVTEQSWVTSLRSEIPPALVFLMRTPQRLVGAQARILHPVSDQRYMTAKVSANDKLVFGLDRVDFGQPVYVTEGPVDSLMASNAVAAVSSNLDGVCEMLGDQYLTRDWVRAYDNESRNPQIVRMMQQTIRRGFPIFIWPDQYRNYKDLNDLVCDQNLTVQRMDWILAAHTYVGVRARVKFLEWSAS